MSPYAGVAIAAKACVLAIGVFMLLASHAVSAEGADSQVKVTVCPTADQVQFSVLQPDSDSTVSEPNLTISGSATFVSQIDVYVDDSYNNTLALNYAENGFESAISLRPGTNTIKIVATGTCGVATIDKSIVVTYQPRAESSVGKDVPTVVEGKVTNSAAAPIVEPEKNSIEKGIDRFIAPTYHAVTQALDIVAPSESDPAVRAGNVARSALFVTGTILTLSAVHIGTLSVSALSDKLPFIVPFRRRAMAATALIGLVLMTLVFIV